MKAAMELQTFLLKAEDFGMENPVGLKVKLGHW
jgi:hypothetical protein